jgi:hypothetical protein
MGSESLANLIRILRSQQWTAQLVPNIDENTSVVFGSANDL